MKRYSLLTMALLFVAASAMAAPGGVQGAPSSALALPISGSFTDAAGGAGTFRGTFHLTSFAATDDMLVAKGYLTGTLTDSTGVSLGTVLKSVALPVSTGDAVAAAGQVSARMRAAAICEILSLQLGPLDLDLLGLVVHLDQVVLDIDAESGGGNLLGNLLCAVTGLLDGAGALVDIANLLNRILGILSGLLG